MMSFPTKLVLLLVFLARQAASQLQDVTVSDTMYQTAVADVISEEFARLGKDVEAFNPIMTDCTKKLNASSEGCQSCLKTVECGSTVTVETGGDSGGRKFKPIDLIHLVNPIDFLKEPLDNILSKLGKAGKFAKNVGKHLVKGLKFIAKGFDKTVIDGLKNSLKGLKKLGSHLGKAVKGLGKGLGKITKSVGHALKSAVKAAGKGVKTVFTGVKSAVKAVGRGVKSVAKAIGGGVKKVWRGIKSLFGRRRRSAPNPEEKACMAKCPDCTPFLSGDELAAVKAVCGADVVAKNVTIAAEVALLDEFFNDVNAAEVDLLTEIKVDTKTGLLTKVTALVRGQYRSFSTDVKFEAFDPASMYKNLARYIYRNYLGL